MNRKKFMKIVAGSILAAVTTPLIVNANKKEHQSEKTIRQQIKNKKDAEFVEWSRGWSLGYVSCLNEIKRQTRYSVKKCLEYDGVMYVAGISGRVL